MGFFNNSKVKKSISVLLASLSIGSFTGCKNLEKEETDELPNEEIEMDTESSYQEQYDEALSNMDVIIEDETIEQGNVDLEQETSSPEKEDNLISTITGPTEKDRLKQILEKKDWGEKEELLLLELYDAVDRCYDARELYNAKDKQMYLRNIVNTIESIETIKIDPNDEILEANGWTAMADYANNAIINKYPNVVNFRHELAHMEEGTFLNGSNRNDLAFVLEEGRASYKEGDAMPRLDWVDSYNLDVNMDPFKVFMVYNCSGSYPAFEEVYKNFINLGIDLEGVRKEAQPVCVYMMQIENELNNMYGNELGTEYMNAVNSYIEFFDTFGKVALEQNQAGNSIEESKQIMDSIYEKCMVQNKTKQADRTVGMER